MASRLRNLMPAMMRRRRFRFAREGLVYLGITVVVGTLAFFFNEAPMLVLVFGIVCAPVLLSGPLALAAIARVRAARRLPRTAFAGEEFTVEITLENRKRLLDAMAMVVEDSLWPIDADFQPRVFFPRVPPGATDMQRYRVVIPERGRYRFGRLRISTRFPFGFFERSRALAAPGELIVYPRLGTIRPRFYQTQQQLQPLAAGTRPRRTHTQEEYHGLRDYRFGDSVRWIHWRTSARRGQLMVKEFEHHPSQQFVVLLDPWLPRKPMPQDRANLELAVSFVATLTAEVCGGMNARLQVAGAGPEPWVLQGTANQRLVHAVLSRLAEQRGGTGDEARGLFSHVDPRHVQRAHVVVVSTRAVEPDDLWPPDGPSSAARTVSVLNASAGDLGRWFDYDRGPGPAVPEPVKQSV